MRWLGIDFGERRVGLALADPASGLAIPWGTIVRTSDRQLIAEVGRVVHDEEVTVLVVGRPERPDGTPSDSAPRVAGFVTKLADALALPVTWVPESLTTVAAAERLRDAGVDARRHPQRLDAVAAQILLEEAMATAVRRARATTGEAAASQGDVG